ncbi:hypothetical protein BV25DRAFT_691947 [Artomyces pyxidatus]|uniref:Uncharacterized protein n=1 Tax=Artomyces pyxidatus TaxID=48021 RepID=A0ACB8T023_9AGAM|nr:hypothetical protein BV25DRAFT_691947 [Artomyces pyxidatus]
MTGPSSYVVLMFLLRSRCGCGIVSTFSWHKGSLRLCMYKLGAPQTRFSLSFGPQQRGESRTLVQDGLDSSMQLRQRENPWVGDKI